MGGPMAARYHMHVHPHRRVSLPNRFNSNAPPLIHRRLPFRIDSIHRPIHSSITLAVSTPIQSNAPPSTNQHGQDRRHFFYLTSGHILLLGRRSYEASGGRIFFICGCWSQGAFYILKYRMPLGVQSRGDSSLTFSLSCPPPHIAMWWSFNAIHYTHAHVSAISTNTHHISPM